MKPIVTYSSDLNKTMCLIYSKSGMGKTPLAATSRKPFFLDVENRMMSLQGKKVPRTDIKSIKAFKESIKFLKKDKKYKTIVLDSVSELARLHFKMLKKKYTENKYEKYDRIYDDIMDVFDKLKSLPHDIIVIAKIKPVELDGVELYRPLLPGRALIPEIPYVFDFVFPLRTWEKDDGEEVKFLQTIPNDEYEAKDTTGNLDKAEFVMDMTKIFKKARGKE